MIYNLFDAFRKNDYFNKGAITIKSRSFYYNKGIVTENTPVETIIVRDKVIVPINTRDLQDMGLGEYIANTNYSLFVKTPLTYGDGTNLVKNDLIEYNGKVYKIISELVFYDHGIYKYSITLYKDEALND